MLFFGKRRRNMHDGVIKLEGCIALLTYGRTKHI
jgi:hypothetical protein